MVEKGIGPAFTWPTVGLTPVFDGSPVGQSDHGCLIHPEKGLSQLVGGRLALVDDHIGRVFKVILVVEPPIVETGNFSDRGQLRGCNVYVEGGIVFLHGTATGRKHGHGGGACRVIPFHQHIQHAVGGYPPVVGGVTGPILIDLQLVTQAPHDNGRMIAVASDPFDDVTDNHVFPGCTAGPVCGVAPFVVEFIDNQDAVLIGQLQEGCGIGIV
ncbi:MAG: hypothetical protein BWY72_00976 [Bacteroidetes bacterium ADurb.Bin416]|nr:MAG: hypothetical protein BWY72_00976 [Bacteroidetes bacterium ADurb.Bin416]